MPDITQDFIDANILTAAELNGWKDDRTGSVLPIAPSAGASPYNYTSATYDLGSATYKWRDIYSSRVAYLTELVVNNSSNPASSTIYANVSSGAGFVIKTNGNNQGVSFLDQYDSAEYFSIYQQNQGGSGQGAVDLSMLSSGTTRIKLTSQPSGVSYFNTASGQYLFGATTPIGTHKLEVTGAIHTTGAAGIGWSIDAYNPSTAQLVVTKLNSSASAVTTAMTIYGRYGSATSAGFGASLDFAIMASDGNPYEVARIEVTQPGAGAEEGAMAFRTKYASVYTTRLYIPANTASSIDITGPLSVSSTANIVGNFSVATSKFTVASSTGNTAIAGTLGVSGALTVSGTGTTTISSAGSISVTPAGSQNTAISISGSHRGVYNSGIFNASINVVAADSSTVCRISEYVVSIDAGLTIPDLGAIYIKDITLGAGSTVTRPGVFYLPAALGTHKFTTNSDKTANAKSGTLKVNVNGTLYHLQLYAD